MHRAATAAWQPGLCGNVVTAQVCHPELCVAGTRVAPGPRWCPWCFNGPVGSTTLIGMNEEGRRILESLAQVAALRDRRTAEPDLDAAVLAVKRFQHHRLTLTYSDLLHHPRFGSAATFFLVDLYGPRDFAIRDAQFARVVPALVRLFPAEIVITVAHLARLHALSEALDTSVAVCLLHQDVGLPTYARAWKEVGRRDDRHLQIMLTRMVGEALDRYTRKPGLRQTLRFMRVPARTAGLMELQQFLERGFDTFHGMGGAAEFLNTVSLRETALADALFQWPVPKNCVALSDFVRHATAGLGEPP